MATAFQPNAFQNNAFQIEEAKAFKGGGTTSTVSARRIRYNDAVLNIKENSDVIEFKAITGKYSKAVLAITDDNDVLYAELNNISGLNLNIIENGDIFKIKSELGLNLRKDEEEFLILLFCARGLL